jgi:thiosulfate reductase cytochrome b subunit
MESVVRDDRRFYRHRLWVRVTHWINVICMTGLLMSGLQIFNAHPALYWGNNSAFDSPFFAIGTIQDAQGVSEGVTYIAGHSFDTSGVLGLSGDPRDPESARAFPAWATLPSDLWLAMGRRWHFFFAWIFVINGLVYGISSIIGRHLRRDLVPTAQELGHIPQSIGEHLRLRFPKGEAAKRYNVIQKLTYLIVAFLLGPVMVLAGLAMSPRLDASYPILLDIFGGRQSARTIHFIIAFAFLAFVVIHLVMVLVSGVWNNLRSMITGWYDIGEDHHEQA